mgnify:CR=1 FL=1
MTAVGVLACASSADRHAPQDPAIDQRRRSPRCASLPRWSRPTAGRVDFYYWYYGTLAMFQVGGARWQRWNEAIKTAIVDHQRTDPGECAFGSWDPIDPWRLSGGRVYATALNCLCMEVYYRYPRVFGGR